MGGAATLGDEDGYAELRIWGNSRTAYSRVNPFEERSEHLFDASAPFRRSSSHGYSGSHMIKGASKFFRGMARRVLSML